MNTIKNNQRNFSRKYLGQNFLQDKKIIEKIIFSISPKIHEELIEIGPGFGSLTIFICKFINMMSVIEIDERLINYLKKHPLLNEKITFFNQDVMKFDFYAFSKKKKKMLRIFGNLPYNISTKIIFYLLRYRHVIYDMHFMLQKDVADRLVSTPNKKTYGRLSIMAQYFFKIIPILDNIPPDSFIPVPKVFSTMVRIIPHKNIDDLINIKTLNKIIIEAFSKRRKMVSNSLKKFFSSEQLNQVGIHSKLRPENISISQYCKLASILEKLI